MPAEPVYVYFARFGNLTKIGATISPRKRRRQLANPEFLFGFFVPDYGSQIGREVEGAFHRHFKHKLAKGYEYFNLSDDDLEEAKGLEVVHAQNLASCLCHPKGYMTDWPNWRQERKRVIMGLIRPKPGPKPQPRGETQPEGTGAQAEV